MKKSVMLTLAVIVLIVAVLTLSVAVIFLINNDSITQKGVLLYANDKIGEAKDTIMHDGNIYISKDFIKDNELLDIYWDEDYNRISIFENFEYHKITYNTNMAQYNNNNYDIENILLTKDNNLYLNIDFLSSNFIPNTFIDKESNIVVICDKIKEYVITSDTILYNGTSNKDKKDKKLTENEIVYIYDYVKNQFILCKTSDGTIGYVDYNHIRPHRTILDVTYTKEKRQDSIIMTWDLQSNKITEFKPFIIPDMVDIIAPTWYELKDDDEYFTDISSDEYTKYVQSTGKKVWATFNNSFDTDLTNLLLNNAYKRSQIVDRIIQITKEKKYDGINIDFENVYMKDRDVYSGFIKELYCKARKEGISMSVAVAVLSSSETWSKFLDRKAIGEYSDYVILMAYDENVSGSAGSVSSIPWVEYGVENLLESVFEGKVVMAVPFYTRLWEESTVDGELKVKATSLRISSAKKVVSDLGIEFTYDEKTGQNYGEKVVDGIRCRIWNEDETSLKNRMNIVRKFNLVGKGVWALNFGTEEMWEVLR